jgi:hypothetical protein
MQHKSAELCGLPLFNSVEKYSRFQITKGELPVRTLVIKLRKVRWADHVACVREKAKGKRQLERHRRRWEDSIQIDRSKIGWELVDWIDLAQGKENWRGVVKVVMDRSVS